MWFLLLWGCRSAPPPPNELWTGHEQVVLGTGSCTILALHGRGDSPDRFRGLYEGMPLDATVLVPQAPDELRHRAYSWFASSRSVDEAELARQIGVQADRLAEAIKRAPVSSERWVVTGFSQGGMLSFALAVRHPDQVSAALPIGGLLPKPLRPTTPGGAVIRAFHGAIDQVVPLAGTQQAITELKTAGWDATLHTYPKVAHQVSRQLKSDYVRALKTACEEQHVR